ncbi:hypothetical protein [Rugosimonospora africana]|uniref:Nitroreductase family protein n=1 Tax=Rugosimonospora africana TaxID=556532 RepID=A0A8J3R4B8_9ACTN|nr:hypothetical protein [Rugosimonospora africana]GIH21095.1 hypothetical protein Raf01_92670 [Rugosimonospora africana]
MPATTEAADIARYAPSIHDSQPWRWRVSETSLDLYTDHRRRLGITDPDGRLAILSCGAALHHARIALAAEGREARVVRLPDPGDPGHLARVDIVGSIPVAPEAMRRIQTVRTRHTDRRPVTGTRLDDHTLAAITAAVGGEGASLHILPRDKVVELAAVSYAQQTEAAEQA